VPFRADEGYSPPKDVTYRADVFYLINGQWVPQDPRITTSNDCYNDVVPG
jgi:hypothetical protein